MKMKTVYEANPALGDPMSIQVRSAHALKMWGNVVKQNLAPRANWLRTGTDWTSWGRTWGGTRAGWRRLTPPPARCLWELMAGPRPVLGGRASLTRWRASRGQPATPASTTTRTGLWSPQSTVRGESKRFLEITEIILTNVLFCALKRTTTVTSSASTFSSSEASSATVTIFK